MSRSALIVIIIILVAIVIYLLYRGGYLARTITTLPTPVVPTTGLSPTSTINATPTASPSGVMSVTPTKAGY